MKNVITLDYSSNPKLAEVFSRKDVGEKCKVELEFTIKNKTPTGLEGSIDELVAQPPEEETPESDTEKVTDKPLRMDIISSEPDTTEAEVGAGAGY